MASQTERCRDAMYNTAHVWGEVVRSRYQPVNAFLDTYLPQLDKIYGVKERENLENRIEGYSGMGQAIVSVGREAGGRVSKHERRKKERFKRAESAAGDSHHPDQSWVKQ